MVTSKDEGQILKNKDEILKRRKEFHVELIGLETTAVEDQQWDEEENMQEENMALPVD